MKLIIFILTILQSIFVLGQKIIDTTEMYEGRLTKKKIEFDQTGNKISETYYFNNGKVQLVDSFHFNKSFHWIAYDSLGTRSGEWEDPTVAAAPLEKKRNILFVICLLTISIIVFAIWRLINYKTAYYSVFSLSLLVSFTAFLQERISNLSEELQFTINVSQGWSILILLSLTFIFSVGNLIFRVNISKVNSIAIAVIAGLISLAVYMGYISALAGRGAVG